MACTAAADLLPEPSPPQKAKALPPIPNLEDTQPGNDKSFSARLSFYALEWGMAFLVPLLLTLLIESPVVTLSGRGTAASWQAGLLANTLTHPIAVLLVTALGPTVLWGSPQAITNLFIGAVEVGVVLIEWRVYRWVLDWSNRRALTTSALANGCSFTLGLLLKGSFLGF